MAKLWFVCISVLFKHASLACAFVPALRRHDQFLPACTTFSPSGDADDVRNKRILIYWRGEALEDYSKDFRELEFVGAIRAIVEGRQASDLGSLGDSITFSNALICSDEAAKTMSDREIDLFNSSLQYLDYASFADLISLDDLKKAVERCSLVNSIYQVGGYSTRYDELISDAESSGVFEALIDNGGAHAQKWRFRLRYFGNEGDRKGQRFGDRTTRSTSREREALSSLESLLEQFSGKVDLKHPDASVVLFDGLGHGKEMALTRSLANGPQISIMNPNTRICVTNTPLCPIAAYSMCNIARVGPNQAILDPYSGSCATLLAATLIEPTVKCVGIEISHEGLVNRRDIAADFTTRGLKPPLALIEGDATDASVRAEACIAVGGAFDVIVADPPYGLRESLSSNPLRDILDMIAADRDAGNRLLKVGGRLVLFVPLSKDNDITDMLPQADILEEVGLQHKIAQRQQLNDGLDRWLVAYECIR